MIICILTALLLARTPAPAGPPQTFPEARAALKSEILERAPKGDGSKPDEPVPSRPGEAKPPFDLITYKSPAGDLAAYLTPDPKDGKKHPAIIVCTGGFGGIGSSSWFPERYTGHFRKAGLMVMCPSWRGQQSNPGRWECFRGEVDDALAALEHVRSLPYVDPSRIYITGHSTGGTMALMVALSTDKVRAAFPLGARLDIRRVTEGDESWGRPAPFDTSKEEELRVRSPVEFIGTIMAPTFAFEGSRSPNELEFPRANRSAKEAGRPFRAFSIEGGDHFNIVDCTNALIASKIAADTGASCAIAFENAEVQKAFVNRRPPFTPRPDLDPSSPILTLTERAAADVRKVMKEKGLDPFRTFVRYGIDAYFRHHASFVTETDEDDDVIRSRNIMIAIDPLSVFLMRGTTIDYTEDEGIIYNNPNEN